jgi:hypothetical protein
MNKTIKILLVVLGLQLLLTAGVFYTSGIIASPPENQLLLNISKSDIKKIVLTGSGGKEVILEKTNELWGLPNKNSFPANQAQINQLLDRLLETELGTKISRQETSHARLRVSDSGFERKVSLFTINDTSHIIYFGSAPSLRQSHARLSKEIDVHVVKFSANDIDIQPDDWLKKDIFTISSKEIKSVAFEKIILSRASNDIQTDVQLSSENSDEISTSDPSIFWEASGLKKKQLSNSSALKFIEKISDMRIIGIATKESIEKIDKSKKPKKYILTLKDGEEIIYKLVKLKGEEDFLFYTSQRKGVFRLPPLSGKDLITSSSMKFLVSEVEKNIDD